MARILICDDAADLRMLIRLTLEAEGHEIHEAAGGHDVAGALTTIEDVDLLVLDVQMPEVDGWAVLEQVRADPGTSDLRVVMCTVKFSEEDLARAWDLGCDGYINKPFDLTDLSETVSRVLAAGDTDRTVRREQELELLRRAQPAGT